MQKLQNNVLQEKIFKNSKNRGGKKTPFTKTHGKENFG